MLNNRTLAAFILLFFVLSTGCKGVISSEVVGGSDLLSTVDLQVDVGNSFDFSSTLVSSNELQSIVLTNRSSSEITNLNIMGMSAPFDFDGGTYPGNGGSCGSTLASNSSCTFIISFSPSATGTYGTTLSIGYTIKSETRSTTLNLSGVGALPAAVFASTAFHNFGSQVVGSLVATTVTLTNSGGSTATSLAVTPIASPYSIVNSCGANLNAGGNCSIAVVFQATALGATASQLDIAFNDGQSPQTISIPISGTGIAPASLSISDGPSYDYGIVVLGTTVTKTYTVTNNGAASASSINEIGLTAPFRFEGGTYPGSSGNCGPTLAAGASCLLSIEFSPTSVGSFSDAINLTYLNGATSTSSQRAVQGEGVIVAAVLTLSGANPFNFGTLTVGASADQAFTLSNTGGSDATGISSTSLSAPFVYKGGTFPGVGGDCTATLVSGDSCTLVVELSPTSAGVASDSIDIDYFDGSANQTLNRNVSGTGLTPAVLTVSNANYDFGSVTIGESSNFAFTIANTGQSTATGMTPSVPNAPYSYSGGYPGTGGTCGANLASGATCTIVISFAPTAAGTHNSDIDLDYSNGAAPTSVNHPFTGTGVTAASLSFTPADFDFGVQAMGSITETTITVTNDGGTTATAINPFSNSPFDFSGSSYPGGGTCGAVLNPGASCTMVIGFYPSSSSLYIGSIDLGYNDGVGSVFASLPVTGTGMPPALLTISHAEPFDFGSLIVSSGTLQTFTVANSGGVTATGLSITGLGGDFSLLSTTCGTTLPAGFTCTVDVQFSPSSPGAKSDSFDVSYLDGTGGGAITETKNVQGTGIAPALLTITDSGGWTFDATAVGFSASRAFTVTNTGAATANTITLSGLASPYSVQSNNCTSLTSGATCTVIVDFSPTAAGTSSDTLDIDYDDGLVMQSLSLNVNGTGQATITAMTVSAGTLFALGNSIDFSVTFSEPVTVTGAPYIAIAIGVSDTTANYLSGNGSTTLVFRRTVGVQSGALSYSNTSIQLNGGSIRTAGSVNASLNFSAVQASLTGKSADGIVPVLSGLSNDANPTNSKTWSWSCSETCLYRYVVNTNSSHTFTVETFGATATATQSSGTATYYIHVQAKDAAGNLSSTISVSAVLDNTMPSVTLSFGGHPKDSNPRRARLLNYGSISEPLSSLEIALTRDADADGTILPIEIGNMVGWTSVAANTPSSIRFKSGPDGTFLLNTTSTYYYTVRAVDLAGNTAIFQSSPFNINHFPWNDTGLLYAYDATDPAYFSGSAGSYSAVANGGQVTRWYNMIGNNYHLDQATIANRPTYQATGFNGGPTISFAKVSGVTRWLSTTSGFGTAGGYSIVMAFASKAATPSSTFASVFSLGNSTSDGSFQLSNAGGNYAVDFNPDGGNGSTLLTYTTATTYKTTPQIFSIDFGSAANEFTWAFDGVDDYMTDPMTLARTQPLKLGARISNTESLDPDIPIVFGIGRVLTYAEREKYEGYIACKTGTQANLTAPHSYRAGLYVCGQAANDF